MSGFTAVGFFLVTLILGMVILSLWLRIALRYLRVSSLNQLNMLITAITNPLIKPIQLLSQYQYKPGQYYDWLAFAVLVAIECIKICLLSLLVFKQLMPLTLVVIYVLADLIIQPCNILFYAILIRVIMSYVNPQWQHPLADFLRILTQPLLILGRKIIPDISGFDFSPFVIMIILKIITLFISASLPLNLL